MSTGNEAIHAEIGRRLRSDRLVYTSGRRRLIEALIDIGHPATVPELLRHRSKLTQSSIYRNLADLEAAGVVRKVAGNDEHARFELEEHFIGHHHHLICVRCGRVDDFVVSAEAERVINDTLELAAGKGGFRLTGHRLDALGICESCG